MFHPEVPALGFGVHVHGVEDVGGEGEIGADFEDGGADGGDGFGGLLAAPVEEGFGFAGAGGEGFEVQAGVLFEVGFAIVAEAEVFFGVADAVKAEALDGVALDLFGVELGEELVGFGIGGAEGVEVADGAVEEVVAVGVDGDEVGVGVEKGTFGGVFGAVFGEVAVEAIGGPEFDAEASGVGFFDEEGEEVVGLGGEFGILGDEGGAGVGNVSLEPGVEHDGVEVGVVEGVEFLEELIAGEAFHVVAGEPDASDFGGGVGERGEEFGGGFGLGFGVAGLLGAVLGLGEEEGGEEEDGEGEFDHFCNVAKGIGNRTVLWEL